MIQRFNSRVLILIPAFNEARVIARVVNGVKSAGWRKILVIDDGSRDLTAKKALKAGAKVISHPRNLGKGAAIKTGFAIAKKLNYDFAVTLDGDGQHHPGDIIKLIKLVQKYDVVLGYRDFQNSNMPRLKIWANYLANWVTGLIYGRWVKDSQSGLRAYTQAALQKIKLRHKKYEVESELIGQISRQNLTWTEVRIGVTYSQYDQTKSTQQTLMTALKTMFSLCNRP